MLQKLTDGMKLLLRWTLPASVWSFTCCLILDSHIAGPNVSQWLQWSAGAVPFIALVGAICSIVKDNE